MLLAKPWGPIDPTASIKRGVFAAGDIWISTEYVFWRDADGDFWLLGNRSGLIRTPRGVVFPAPITDAIGAHPGGRPGRHLRRWRSRAARWPSPR